MMQASPRLPAAKMRILLSGVALIALTACEQTIDTDLRSLGEGFSTTDAALAAGSRPAPDSRGVISYPTYQVAVARQGDTVRSISTRLGLNAETVASYNATTPDAPLRRDELVALPTRIPDAGGGMTDVTAVATAALDRAGDVTTTSLPSSPVTTAPLATSSPQPAAPPVGTEPIQHRVQRGETGYSIARLYGVPVSAIAEWNALGPDLAVREGQQLLIPQGGGSPPANATTAPGAGSPTPVPPSASTPLPEEVPAPAAQAATEAATVAPDLGAQQTTAPRTAAMVRPAQGPIIRDYVSGRNEGIDIGAPAGAEVRAAAAGVVAAVTTNTDGIQIVVIKHADNILTVYTNLDSLTVTKDATVTQGQVIGRVRAGDPSFVHFEVRRGMESQDPTNYLP